MGMIALVYGLLAYLVFFGSFLYAIGFVGNLVVSKAIDDGGAGPLGQALVTNVVLLGLFAVQHSVMARQWFKARWIKIVPPSVERSTYVLVSSLILILLYWKWEPMPAPVWQVEASLGRGLLQALFWLGWGLVLVTTFLIDHFDLFGLRQVILRFQGKAYTPVPFKRVALYNYVRHPLLLGFLIAFWSTPEMSQGHLLFAVATTGYVLLAIQFEERDLVRFHGASYEAYRKEVSMLLPFGRRRGG